MEKEGSSHFFYFLIFIFGLLLQTFLRSKKKREKEERQAEAKKRLVQKRTRVQKDKPLPHLPIGNNATIVNKMFVEKNGASSPYAISKKNGEPRIKTLVKTLPSKKDMIIIAEILKPYEPIQ